MAASLRIPVFVALLPLVACGGNGLGPGRADSGVGPGGDAGGTRMCERDRDCDAGERCGTTGRCIPEGGCLVDADCASGQRCGAVSRVCLDDGACMRIGDCPEGMECDEATLTCKIGGGCGMSQFGTTRLTPNMMILLDRSGSMDGDIGGRTRWDVAKDAVRTVTERFDDSIRFGLATYSSCLPGGCSAGSIVVPIGDTNATAVNGFLAPLAGRGSRSGTPPDYLCDSGDPETSTGKSLQVLVGEPTLQDTERDNTVLLVTDGAESGSCVEGGIDGPAGAANLLGQTVPVKTYVVGFSRDVDAAALDRVAMAGGTGMFHPADDAASLVSALEAIASDVATCVYRLDMAPPDTTMLYVYFNDDPAGVPQDAADGWTYDEATMTLECHGASCAQIQMGAVTDIDVVYGCEGPVLE